MKAVMFYNKALYACREAAIQDSALYTALVGDNVPDSDIKCIVTTMGECVGGDWALAVEIVKLEEE